VNKQPRRDKNADLDALAIAFLDAMIYNGNSAVPVWYVDRINPLQGEGDLAADILEIIEWLPPTDNGEEYTQQQVEYAFILWRDLVPWMIKQWRGIKIPE
jgi:hypothetical protein